MTIPSGNLAGMLVIDFSQIAAGPTCTMMLADRGADVLKIEPPGGDMGRHLGPPFINGHGTIFMSLNRNKRSAALDLKNVEDLEVARALTARADIVVESFRPGVMAKFGLDYTTLSARNPGLVYCSISAYGQEGAYRNKAGVDGIVQAVSGLMSITGSPDGVPAKVQSPIVDMTTGFLACTAVLDALMTRQRTGAGAHLDVSMYAAGIQLQQMGLASYLSSGEVPQPCGSAAPYAAPNEAFPTADGWLMLAAYQPKRWSSLCHILKLNELVDDPRYCTSDLRVANRTGMVEALSAKTRTWQTATLIEALEQADILCGPVSSYADVAASPVFAHMTTTVEHAEAGTVPTIIPFAPARSDSYRCGPIVAAPLLGQHTQAAIDFASTHDAGIHQESQ